MKKLTAIFLLLSNGLLAQVPTGQKATPFDKFISKPEIEWAAYINDTVRFKKVNFNALLLKRLTAGEIRASLPVGSGSYQADKISYLNKKEIDDKILYTKNRVAVFDSTGNMVREEERRSDNFDTTLFTLTDATQILYIENGQLKTYTPWVAPMKPVTTSTGLYLGEGDLFAACFNFSYTYRSSKQNKIVWLGQYKKKISLDSFQVINKLKELYGRNLLQTLWPYVLKNKIRAFDYEKNNRINPGEFTTDLLNGARIPISLYDSAGNIVGHSFAKAELVPQVFTTLELVQDWYYDRTANIIFTTAREAYLYAKKWTNNGEPVMASPIIKLVFQ